MEGIQQIIDDLRAYAGPIDENGIDMLSYNIRTLGLDFVIKRTLRDLDCTRLWNGRTICQTISVIYKGNLSEIFYIIDTQRGFDKQALLEEIVKIHQNNLEYEKVNPPIVYKDKKVKIKKEPKNVKARQTRLFDDVSTKRANKFINLNIVIK